jgi:glycosyltransferase involved in cell wall biosynthesis
MNDLLGITKENHQRIRVLLLSNMYPSTDSPSYGIFVKNIYTQFREVDIDIQKCVIEGQSHTKLGKVFSYAIYVLKALFMLAFTRRLVYIHFVAHTSFPVLLLSLFRRFDIVAHVHGGDVMTQPQVGKRWTSIKTIMAEKTLRLSKKVIVPSQYFSEFLQNEFRIDARSIFVSPSGGVDTRLFLPAEKKAENTITLGYVGRLDPGKGVNTLLEAMNVLNKQRKQVSLTVVGTGNEKESLHQFVIENGLNGTCCFVDALAHQDLVGYYQTFDYFLFPSELNESLGLVGLEAMACGTPIITTGRAGISDYFKNKVNGFQFDSGNHLSLSEVISNLPPTESSIYQRMAKQCRQTALKFDSELVKKALIREFSII